MSRPPMRTSAILFTTSNSFGSRRLPKASRGSLIGIAFEIIGTQERGAHPMEDKVALITGTTGQDGAYLAELLLAKGYIVHGLKRRSSSLNTQRVDHLYVDPHVENARFFLHYGDMTDATNLIRLI